MELRKLIKKNKKGQLGTIAVLGILVMVVIFLAFAVTLGSGILTFASAQVEDITGSLGMAGGSNLSAISDVSIGTANTTIQMLSFLSGIFIVFALLGIIIFAGAIRSNPSGWLIGFYLILVVIVLFVAIFMSNTYEEILDGSDDLATQLQTMTMASFLVLYMPTIITVIAFVGGIIIFSGSGQEF